MKRIYLSVIISITVLAVSTLVAGTSSTTPLYTVRYQQASSSLNFLPTAVTGFTYTTQKGYTLQYDCLGHYGTLLDVTTGKTCEGTCQGQQTCQGYTTCDLTCWGTCPNTCGSTCPLTCSTCEQTCFTCDTCYVSCLGECQPP